MIGLGQRIYIEPHGGLFRWTSSESCDEKFNNEIQRGLKSMAFDHGQTNIIQTGDQFGHNVCDTHRSYSEQVFHQPAHLCEIHVLSIFITTAQTTVILFSCFVFRFSKIIYYILQYNISRYALFGCVVTRRTLTIHRRALVSTVSRGLRFERCVKVGYVPIIYIVNYTIQRFRYGIESSTYVSQTI